MTGRLRGTDFAEGGTAGRRDTAPGTGNCAEVAMRTHPEGHGPVRFGPPLPEDGLPVLPELAGVLAAAASRVGPEPVGGGPALIDAACGYGERRGLPAAPAARPSPPARPPCSPP